MERARKTLTSHLAPGGIIVGVYASKDHGDTAGPGFVTDFDTLIGPEFTKVHDRRFDDPKRPYHISAFARR